MRMKDEVLSNQSVLIFIFFGADDQPIVNCIEIISISYSRSNYRILKPNFSVNTEHTSNEKFHFSPLNPILFINYEVNMR